MIKTFKNWLDSKAVFYILLALVVLQTLFSFYLGTKYDYPDGVGYLNMADGLRAGRFSSWFFLPEYVPETLRLWGYPLFLAIFRTIHSGTALCKFAQLFLHFGALYLLFDILEKRGYGLVSKNLLLLLLLPQLQIGFYAALICPQSLSGSLIILLVHFWATRYYEAPSYSRAFLMAVMSAAVYQVKPSFLLFPFVYVFTRVLLTRGRRIGSDIAFCLLFCIFLLPFGFWSQRAHGIFKVTPLSGGGDVAYLGYWMYRLPHGYRTKFNFNNFISRDMFQPNFFGDDDEEAIRQYEAECAAMSTELDPLLSASDLNVLSKMEGSNPGQFLVYPGPYVKKKESLLWRNTIKNMGEAPLSYVASRVYTLCRFWFTGLPVNTPLNVQGLKRIYLFVVTMVSIFGGCLLSLYLIASRRAKNCPLLWLMLLFAYFDFVHVGFAVQARYAVPLHALVLLLLAVCISQSLFAWQPAITEDAEDTSGSTHSET